MDGHHRVPAPSGLSPTSPSALRMRRLRERRLSNTHIVSVEVTAADRAYLRAHGFLREGETTRQHLTLALHRLLQSIR